MQDDLLHPLENPAYDPVHKPQNGRVPSVVAKWGKASQLRWFKRFRCDVAPLRDEEWSLYWVFSEHHMGVCCDACEVESWDGYGSKMDGFCCCRDRRIQPV